MFKRVILNGNFNDIPDENLKLPRPKRGISLHYGSFSNDKKKSMGRKLNSQVILGSSSVLAIVAK